MGFDFGQLINTVAQETVKSAATMLTKRPPTTVAAGGTTPGSLNAGDLWTTFLTTYNKSLVGNSTPTNSTPAVSTPPKPNYGLYAGIAAGVAAVVGLIVWVVKR